MILPTRRTGVLLAFAVLSVQVAVARARLYVLNPVGSSDYSFPVDVSADGRVVAGNTGKTNGLSQAFRQVRPHDLQEISTNLAVESSAVSLSADGSVVLGS